MHNIACKDVIASLGLAFLVSVSCTLPPPDISNIAILMEPLHLQQPATQEALATGASLLIVLSHVGSAGKRHTVRTFYPDAELASMELHRIFLIASLSNQTEPDPRYHSVTDAVVLQEGEVHGDLLWVNMTEAYNRCTYKVLAGLAWASAQTPHARHVIKMDDDILVDLYTVMATLKRLPIGEQALIGVVLTGERPVRDRVDPMRFTSVEEFANDVYPDFLSGWLYAMSPAVVSLLVKTSSTVAYHHSEDLYITGMVADKAGLRRHDLGPVFDLRTRSLNCCRTLSGARIACQFLAATLDGGDGGLRARWTKQHGRHCAALGCPGFLAVNHTRLLRCF